jgi:HlyD family secretion protein
VPGKVATLLADEGNTVKKGQKVASLAKEELQNIRDQAQGSFKEAELNWRNLEQDSQRLDNLFTAGSVSEQKKDAAKTAAATAQARMESWRAALGLAEVRLNYADLYAPLDGMVLVKSAESGEYIQPGGVIFTVADLRAVWLTGYVSETDLGKVKLNQEVNVKTDTFPSKVYTGKITFIAAEAEFTPKQILTKEERVKRVYRIKISIDNETQELKPGMPAEGYIKLS